MILKIILLVALLMLFTEWLLARRAKKVRHINAGATPPIESYWLSKWQMLMNILLRRAVTTVTYEKVAKNLMEDTWIRYTITGDVSVVVCTPEAIKTVLAHQSTDKNHDHSAIQQNPHFDKIIGQSLLLQYGKKAASTRMIMNPAFKHKKMQSIFPVFVDTANQMVVLVKERYKDGDIVPVDVWFKNLTYDVIGKAAFGHHFHSLESPSSEVSDMELCFSGLVQPLALLFGKGVAELPTAFQKKLHRARVSSTKLIEDVINERRTKRNESNVEEERDNKDLLDLILDADTEGLLTTEELVQNTYLLFLAGQETSAGALNCIMYSLGLNPEIQEKAYEEVTRVVAGENLTAEHVDNLKYIDACVKESLRLHAPVDGVLPRVATEDLVLNDYFVPKGTILAVNWAKINRSSRYHENPLEYRPERWLGPNAVSSSNLLSFSTGPRVCVGKNFAMIEMKVVLATLLLNFSWTVPKDYKFELQPFTISLTPKYGMPIQFYRRQS